MPDEIINVVIEDKVEQININVNDFSTSKIISTDVGNAAELGSDGGVFVPPSAGGGVTSVFARGGDVVAESGDYDTSLVTEVADKKYVTDAEKLLLASTSGTNTGDQDLSGLEPAFSKNTAFNKNFGAISDTVVEGNDVRMSDARTPLAHTHPQSNVDGLVTDLGNKLDKNISTLTAVTLPLLDTDKLIVNRGGVDYSVDKSELGGGTSLRTAKYDWFNGTGTFATSANWYGARRNVANQLPLPLWASVESYYDGTTDHVTNVRMPSYIVDFNQKIDRLTFTYESINIGFTFRLIYYELNPSGASNQSVNDQIIYEAVIASNVGGIKKQEIFVPNAFTASTNGYFAVVILNNSGSTLTAPNWQITANAIEVI